MISNFWPISSIELNTNYSENDMGQLKEFLLNVTLLHIIEDLEESSNYLLSTNYLLGLILPNAILINPEKYTLLLIFLKCEETDL